MNATRIRQDIGVLVAMCLSIIATVVAMSPAKLLGKGAIWPFVVGLVVILIGPLLWRLGNLISGDRTSKVLGAVLFVVALAVAIGVVFIIALNLKNFSWPQAGWGALSGTLLAAAYYVHRFTCGTRHHAAPRPNGPAAPAASVTTFGGQPPAGPNPHI